MILRDYQIEAVDAAIQHMEGNGSTLLVMATGTGKTVVIAHVLNKLQPRRALIMAHRDELIQQLSETIEAVTGEECSIEKADSWAPDPSNGGSRFVVATVQTLVASWTDKRRMHRWDKDEFDVVIIDEAHHAAAKTYREIVDRFGGHAQVLGVTATPKRGDDLALGSVFRSACYTYDIRAAIDDGWLVPIRQRRVVVDSLDLSGVSVSAGDLNGRELADELEQEKTLHAMVGPTFDLAAGRPTLIFCASVAQAQRAAEIWNRKGEGRAEFVYGGTPKEDRRRMFEDYRAGRIQCLTNVGVATEGTDLPTVAVVAMARPTKVRSLYQQMLGRGTRPLRGVVDGLCSPDLRKEAIAASNKPTLDVIDFVGNSGRHKLITPFDILGGKWPQEVIDKAAELHKEDDLVDDVDGALEEAAQLLEEERQALQRKLEEEQRKIEEMRRALRVRTQYSVKAVDPFDILDVPPPAALPAQSSVKIKPATEKQSRLLLQNGIDPTGMTTVEASRLVGQIIQRNRKGLATYKQLAFLRKKGVEVPENLTRKQASEAIDRIING